MIKKLNFETIQLKLNLDDASQLIFKDRKHLDNNPRSILKQDIVGLLDIINSGKSLESIIFSYFQHKPFMLRQ